MRPIGDWSTWMTLSSWSRPVIRRCVPGRILARCRRLATARKRISLTSVDLPEPDTPVTQREHAERDAHVDVLEVVLRGALDLDVARRAPALLRDLDAPRAGQELAGQRPLDLRDLRRGALGHRPRRRARPRPGRGRAGGRPPASCPRRARRRSPCCRGRAGARASRSASRCRAGAGRSTARRGCRARPPARSRSGSPGGCAAPRRPRASPRRAPSRGSRRRRCRGSAAARRSRAGSAARCGARSR